MPTGTTGSQPAKDRTFKIAVLALACSVSATIAAVLAGLGNRYHWWDFRVALSILRWAYFGGFLSLVFAGGTMVLSRQRRVVEAITLSLISLMLAATINANALSFWLKARSAPPIHDVTTDTARPPEFFRILDLRRGAPNQPYYSGPESAKRQQQAYPDIQPLKLNIAPDQAFSKAEQIANEMGWEVVAANPAEGRIEAVATSFWFGFKDDIVIRVLPDDQGSRIDIRSSSRVGRNDLGANAERIRAFIRAMNSYSWLQKKAEK